MVSVDWNQAERIAADAGDVHGFPNAVVGRHRGVGRELFRTCGDTRAPHFEGKLGIAGNQDADEVGHRGSRDKQAGRALRKTEDPPHPPDDLALHLDRGVIAPPQVGVQPRREHLRQHTNGCAAAMHPAHETRVRVAGGERQNIAHEFPMNGGQIGRRLGNIATEPGPHLVGKRLPDGTCADVFDVVENVIQHPVSLRPKARPIGRVECAALARRRICAHIPILASPGSSRRLPSAVRAATSLKQPNKACEQAENRPDNF